MKKIFFLLFICSIFFLSAQITNAAEPLQLVPACALAPTPNCTVCDVLNQAVNYAKMILGVLSSVVLVMFILGGFYLITSAGNQERLTKGKKIILAAVTGILIVAFAWVGVNTVLAVLMGKNATTIDENTQLSTQISEKPWWQFPYCSTNVKAVSDCNPGTVALHTPCSQCKSGEAAGTTGCFCEWDENVEGRVNLKGGTCNTDGKKCECISLCDMVKQNYPAYSDYECRIKNDPTTASDREGILNYDYCLSGNFCPYSPPQDPQYQCCKPQTPSVTP